MASLLFVDYEKPGEIMTTAKRHAIRSQAARHHWAEGSEVRASKRIRTNRGRKATKSKLTFVGEEAVGAAVSLGSFIDDSFLLHNSPWCLLGAGRIDPFQTYPVPWEPYLPEVVDHYIFDMAVDVPEIDGPGKKGLLRTMWFPLVVTEPSTFLTLMLLAASHLYSIQARPNVAIDLLKLKSQAIQSINEGLLHPTKAVSDAVIGAVAKMCSYEATYGSMQSYVVHMKGLQKLIELRGGLPSLGLDGVLSRMCLWIDLNSAFLNKSPRFLEGQFFKADQTPPEPNPGHFIGRCF